MSQRTSIFRHHRFMTILILMNFVFFGSSPSALGQCEPEEPPTLSCEDAPILCLNQFCYQTQLIPVACCTGWCGPNTAIHNPQYFQFIPVASAVAIEIHVDDCVGGNALQSAILDACPWDNGNVIACDPGTPPGGTMLLEASGLFPGQPYWVVIDGSAGSTCDYTFTSVQGILGIELGGTTGLLTADPAILPSVFDTIHLSLASSITNSHGYYWTFSWHTDTITTSDPELDIYTPCLEEPGIYTICVRAYNGCDTLDNEVCTTIELLAAVDRIKPAVTLCPESFPFTWQDIIIPGPGTYVQTFYPQVFPGRCPFDSIWQVDAYPDLPDGSIDTALCAAGFLYEGQLYDTSGTYTLLYPGQGLNGCDSVALLTLAVDNGDFFIETICSDSQFTLRPFVITHSSSSDSITFAWYDCSYNTLLSTSDMFTPDTGGCYCLVLDHGFCIDTICSTYAFEPCAQTCSLVDQTVCAGDSVLFTYAGDIPSGATLHWLIDLPGAASNYFTGTDSVLLTYDTTGCFQVSLTIVDSFMTWTCVDSFCVEKSDAVASVCCTESKCDTCTTITVEMSGTPPWTLYIHDGSQTDTISAIAFSPYLHVVCPPGDSATAYTFQVYNNVTQCPGSFSGDNPITIALSSPPLAEIIQQTDTLCAHPAGMAAYHWFGCTNGESIATSQCTQPNSSGCYCVEVTTQGGCKDTACYDFVISGLPTLEQSQITISPIPSSGSWDIVLDETVVLPVEWSLMDPWGRRLEAGELSQSNSKIELSAKPPSGVYFLKFQANGLPSYTIKVAIHSN